MAALHVNLTPPLKYKQRHVLQHFPCINDFVYAKFEGFRTFLYVFMRVAKVFALKNCG